MEKQITVKLRLTSLLTDWLTMNVGLLSGIVLILLINLGTRLMIGDYLAMSINHLLLIFLVYLPWILLHIWFDITKNGSLGKQLFQLIIHYKRTQLVTSIVRNLLKWVPVFMIISAIIFICMNHFSSIALGLIIISLLWIMIHIILLKITDGQWHLIDKIVGTRVVRK